jgi:hypothetical protein
MPDFETLRMALIGYQAERRKIDEKIAALEARLTGNSAAPETAVPAKAKRRMSRAAKARIAAAQRKRWAQFRNQREVKKTAPAKKKAAAKKTARKAVSPEVRQKRLEALAKARAARAAKRSAAKSA